MTLSYSNRDHDNFNHIPIVTRTTFSFDDYIFIIQVYASILMNFYEHIYHRYIVINVIFFSSTINKCLTDLLRFRQFHVCHPDSRTFYFTYVMYVSVLVMICLRVCLSRSFSKLYPQFSNTNKYFLPPVRWHHFPTVTNHIPAGTAIIFQSKSPCRVR